MNLRNLDFEELSAELAPLRPTRTALLKLFAAVFARGAGDIEEVANAPQVPRALKAVIQERGELPALRVVERRRAADGFVKYLFESPRGGRVEAVRIPIFDEKYVVC
ncbi:MAG TPA: rRNA methyltransferase, partial [Myxococcaceae bacterium]|nr:rRNA methyltransferase [Myxococcaceae bacterium]